ncbi:4-coumarate--CoA ligase 1-like [Drosophila novamexicana]|uniref:4-coumarate--CoA ligase 1-like n=1 Tax=Drosophila novamexicana TaxID=47314 RepID=UPI0011E5CFC4|nr:4-coumarate--CoA ligase 1-like [Drosophila novamexicana]
MCAAGYDPIKRIWRGEKSMPLYDFDCSIGRIIHNNLKNNPKKVCHICIEDGKTVTSQQILNWSVRLAQNFEQRGLRHDDVICISAKNSTYVTPAAVACLFNATPFHAVNPILDINTLTHVLTITKPKLIFCDAVDYEKLKTASAAWTPELITVTGKVEGVTYIEELLSPTETEMLYRPKTLILGGDQTMLILCSSGTTGLPKAVCIANNMLDCSNNFVTAESVVYCPSGLDWVTGILSLLWSVANGCTRILTNQSFSENNFLELVVKYKITIAILAPVYVSALVTYPAASAEKLASLRTVFVGGGWMPSETLQKMQNLLKNGVIIFMYAATEFGQVACAIFSEKLGITVGKPLPGIQVRILDENCSNLSHGEVGEICVHHGRKWSGYYGNPIETQRMQDSSGWFHSGDLGYFDENNNLYIVDRKKEIYKCLGMQYGPTDIEAAIAELPDVQEVCVVGLYDEKYGDAPAAMVVKRPGSTLTGDQIKEHVSKRLVVEFKQLHGGVYFVGELPYNANGKVLRRTVKEKLTQAYLNGL